MFRPRHAIAGEGPFHDMLSGAPGISREKRAPKEEGALLQGVSRRIWRRRRLRRYSAPA